MVKKTATFEQARRWAKEYLEKIEEYEGEEKSIDYACISLRGIIKHMDRPLLNKFFAPPNESIYVSNEFSEATVVEIYKK